MGDHGKFRIAVIGGMNIDGKDSVGAFLSCDPATLRGIAALFGADVSIVAADRITALEAQVAAADRLAEAAKSLVSVAVGYQNMPGYSVHPMVAYQIDCTEAFIAAYRAAKGE